MHKYNKNTENNLQIVIIMFFVSEFFVVGDDEEEDEEELGQVRDCSCWWKWLFWICFLVTYFTLDAWEVF